jgi:dihydrofolate reductase
MICACSPPASKSNHEGAIMTLPLTIVAAVAKNSVIGGGNKLLWHLPSDLKHYREATWGKPMIMGRKTYESIGRPLPGRETIVVTRDARFTAPEGVHIVSTIEAALACAQERALAMGADEIILAGGGELYRALLDRVDRLRMTFVDLEPEGDAFFPQIDWSQWREIRRE